MGLKWRTIDVNSNILTTEDFFLLPCETSYNINFTVDVVMDGVQYDNGDYKNLRSTSLQATVSNVSLEMGSAYNFVATITPGVITGTEALSFEIQHIPDWNGKTVDGNTVQVFTDLDKLKIAAKLGGEITLERTTNIPCTIDVASDLIINLNGNTINHSTTNTLFNVIGSGTLKINGNNNDASAINSTGCIADANDANTKVTINGGIHTTTAATIYRGTYGDIIIRKGSFAACGTYDSTFGENSSRIFINGGRFHEWNPSGNVALEDDNENIIINNGNKINYLNTLSYVNEMFKISYKDSWYTVKRETPVIVDNISNAINDEYVEKLIISNNTIENKAQKYTIKHDMEIVGENSNTIIIGGGHTNNEYAFRVQGGSNVKIKNLNIIGGGIEVSTGTLEVEDCNIYTKYASSGRAAIMAWGGYATIKNSNITIGYEGSAKGHHYFSLQGGTIEFIVTENNRGVCRGTNKTVIYTGTSTLILKGGNFDQQPPAASIAEGYKSAKSGSYWIVSPDPDYVQP